METGAAAQEAVRLADLLLAALHEGDDGGDDLICQRGRQARDDTGNALGCQPPDVRHLEGKEGKGVEEARIEEVRRGGKNGGLVGEGARIEGRESMRDDIMIIANDKTPNDKKRRRGQKFNLSTATSTEHSFDHE